MSKGSRESAAGITVTTSEAAALSLSIEHTDPSTKRMVPDLVLRLRSLIDWSGASRRRSRCSPGPYARATTGRTAACSTGVAGAPEEAVALWAADSATSKEGQCSPQANASLPVGVLLDASNIVVPAQSLLAGGSYTFTLLAAAADGRVGLSALIVNVARPPWGGSFTASPPNGTVGTTIFELTAPGWGVDDAASMPLTYSFYSASAAAGAVLSCARRSSRGPSRRRLPTPASSTST